MSKFSYTKINQKNCIIFNTIKFTKLDIIFLQDDKHMVLYLKQDKPDIKYIKVKMIIITKNNINCSIFAFY